MGLGWAWALGFRGLEACLGAVPEMQLVDAARLSCLPLQGRCILGVAAASARSPQLTAQWPHVWVEFVLCQTTVGSIHNYQPGLPHLLHSRRLGWLWADGIAALFSRFGGSLKERQLTLPFGPETCRHAFIMAANYSYESGRYFGGFICRRALWETPGL